MKKEKIIPLWMLGLFIVLLWMLSTIIIKYFFVDWSKSASFGDTFGAINSLFSGLALAGIIYTIYLQKTELSLQREELKYTREELKRTADAQESSNKMMTEQLRINNIPYIQFQLEWKSIWEVNNIHLHILNNSEKPAFDFEIWLFYKMNNFYFPVKEFIEEQIIEDFQSEYIHNSELLHNNYYFIGERGNYNYFKKNGVLELPIDDRRFKVDDFDILVQYRDVLDNNYYQNLSFNRDVSKEKMFVNRELLLLIPTVCKRIDLMVDKLNDDSPDAFKKLLQIRKNSIPISNLEFESRYSLDDKYDIV